MSVLVAMKWFLIVLCFLSFLSVKCFRIESDTKTSSNTPTAPIPTVDENNDRDVGSPLLLTPLIEAHRIKEAQELSRVKPDIGNVTSFSGFLTTNKTCGNNLFFWFFPALEAWENAPLVLWLQGGPGVPSVYGLFEEIGPFRYYPDGLKRREYSWYVKHNLLFIDQPVGTGFSFTEKGCYAKDETDIGENLYSALIQFLKLFQNLQRNKVFIAGESFAGHYIPAIGFTIHSKNPTAELKINLGGMMIGDGVMDPKVQHDYGDYLYKVGLVDDKERKEFYTQHKLYVQQIDSKQWDNAMKTLKYVHSLFHIYASVDIYNYLHLPGEDPAHYQEYIQTSEVRKSIHVGNIIFHNESYVVFNFLTEYSAQSSKPRIETLLDSGYPIVFYVGQVDVTCAYTMVVQVLRSLHWSGQEEYLNATRTHWRERDGLAGYIKVSRNMAEVLVRDAGHMVPRDQPFWAYQLVNKFTSGGIQALVEPNAMN